MIIEAGKIIVGEAGRATEIKSTREATDPMDWSATIAGWFLQCPGQSPMWQHYNLAMMHLRPIEGVQPAEIRRPNATHEIMLFALDPDRKPNVLDHKTWQYLTPLNYVEQLILPDDSAARVICGVCAKAVADGILWAEPPLSKMREPWQSHLKALEDHSWGRHERK